MAEARPSRPSGGDPDATDAASLAPAGERSYVTWDPTLGRIVRIDPDTGDVAELLDLDEGAYAMTQGDGALWMGLESGTVLRIDPTTGEQIAEIPPATSEGLFDIAAADGAAWTMHGVPGAGTSLVRIDGSTNTAGTPIPAGTGISFYDVEAGDGAVYVVGTSPTMATTLYVVDPAAGTLTDLEVPMIIDTTAVGGGQVWMGGTFFPEGATTGVPGVGSYDPATGELTTLELPAEPGSIAVGPGAVWAVTGIGARGDDRLPHRPLDDDARGDHPGRRDRGRAGQDLDRCRHGMGDDRQRRRLRDRSRGRHGGRLRRRAQHAGPLLPVTFA